MPTDPRHRPFCPGCGAWQRSNGVRGAACRCGYEIPDGSGWPTVARLLDVDAGPPGPWNDVDLCAVARRVAECVREEVRHD